MRAVDSKPSPENNFLVPEHLPAVLEIGVGCLGLTAFDPRAPVSIGRYVLTDNTKDFGPGVDTFVTDIWRQHGTEVIAVRADGAELPFKDNMFDVVVTANVMGDPLVLATTRHKILDEAARVATAGIYVVEYATPRWCYPAMNARAPQSSPDELTCVWAENQGYVCSWTAAPRGLDHSC